MRTLALLVSLALVTAPAANAQSAAPAPAQPGTPFSLDRIKRQLSAEQPSTAEGIRIKYYLDVVGKMPAFEFFKDFDLEVGPLSYGGPTHNEILSVVTPEEFRSPVMNFSNVSQVIAAWFAKRAAEKKAKSQQQ